MQKIHGTRRVLSFLLQFSLFQADIAFDRTMDNGSAKGVAAHGSVVAQLGRSKIQQSFHENDDDGGQGEHARNGGMHASGLRAGTNEDVSPWRISRCLRGGAAAGGAALRRAVRPA